MGKRFGGMKTALGYDERHVFHSIRYTVAGMFQDAGCAEGVAADIVGHLKPGLTFGLYGGITTMKLRYGELVRRIAYPTMGNGESSTTVTTWTACIVLPSTLRLTVDPALRPNGCTG
jgi:hypothetical protein